MNYIPYALLALVAYSFVPPLVSVATRSGGLSSDVVALVTNTMLAVAAAGVVLASGRTGAIGDAITGPQGPVVLATGVCLSVGIIAYYRALRLGPVSVVAPVFGMFLVTASVVGVVVLDEEFTLRKAAGIGCAVLAVYLTTTE